MSSVLGIERRRTGSIGIEEKTLSALEQFVELCDKGIEEDELENENGGDENTTPAAQSDHVKGSVESLDIQPLKSGSKSNEDLRRSSSGGSSARQKLCELFIDRKVGLRSPKSVSPSPVGSIEDNSTNSNSSATNGTLKSGNNNGSTTQPIKKSEEIWVRRAAGGRRSFRVTVSSI
jgi:hypothetical protein